ncbi:MAG: hypothetical protein JXA28_05425, partial [Bacteroidetes bacterium]|nr:hypothetical protein [Bacteroidota bacterium]
MSDAPHICFTFVGDVTRDSRLRRFRQAAAEIGRVSLVSTSLTSSASLRRELPRFWRSGREEARALHADLYLAADLYSLPIAAAAARHAGSPFIYDARELYRSIAALVGRPVMQHFWSLLEQRYTRRAHTVLTV